MTRTLQIDGRDVEVTSWEIRAPGCTARASDIASEHEAREELRCARRRGIRALLLAVTTDGAKVEVTP